MVVSSWAMPLWAKTSLAKICTETLRADQFTMTPRRFGVALKHLARFIAARYPAQTDHPAMVRQTILDDDGFSTDLIASARREMAELPTLANPGDLRFVSFSRAMALICPRKARKIVRSANIVIPS